MIRKVTGVRLAKGGGGRIRNAWLALFAILLQGCAVDHTPVLELHRADLVTPFGRVPIEIGTERHLSIYRSNRAQEMIVEHEDLMVRIRVLPTAQHLLVSSSTARRIEVVRDDAFYQRNGGVNQPISFRPSGNDSEQQYDARFDFDLPPPLALFYVMEDGTLQDQSTQRIEMREDDVHVLYLPFLVDAELFAIDLEFNIEIETRRHVGVPATP